VSERVGGRGDERYESAGEVRRAEEIDGTWVRGVRGRRREGGRSGVSTRNGQGSRP
jgi:hypothetical protein